MTTETERPPTQIYLGDLTMEQKKKRHEKQTKFFEFIYYDWGDEKKGDKIDIKTGSDEWQIYKEVHKYQQMTEAERQNLKREFYTKRVDKEFENILKTDGQEEMKEFQKYCQYVHSMGETGFTTKKENSATMTKHMFYLLYLMMQPLGIPYAWTCFFAGAMITFLQRNNFIKSPSLYTNSKGKPVTLMHSVLEEDTLNLFLMVFLIPSGDIMKSLIHASLSIWSLIHIVDMIISSMAGENILTTVLEYVKYSKIELNMYKSHIELLIGFFATPAVFLNQAAIIFPIMYFQYIRIKYVSSFFMQHSFSCIDQKILKNILPGAIYDSDYFKRFQKYIMSYVNLDKNPKNGTKEAEQPTEEEKAIQLFRAASEQQEQQFKNKQGQGETKKTK